jgi:hypothetical protein
MEMHARVYFTLFSPTPIEAGFLLIGKHTLSNDFRKCPKGIVMIGNQSPGIEQTVHGDFLLGKDADGRPSLWKDEKKIHLLHEVSVFGSGDKETGVIWVVPDLHSMELDIFSLLKLKTKELIDTGIPGTSGISLESDIFRESDDTYIWIKSSMTPRVQWRKDLYPSV